MVKQKTVQKSVKRGLSLSLAILLCFGIVGCSKKPVDTESKTSSAAAIDDSSVVQGNEDVSGDTESSATGEIQSGTEGNSASNTGSKQLSTSNSSQSASSGTKLSVVKDLKGRKIKIFQYGYNKEWATNTEVGRQQEELFDKVEKNLNCTIQIVAGPGDTDFGPIFTSILSGRPSVDIVGTAGPHTLAKPITTGLYQDLNQFAVFNWKGSNWDTDTMKIANFNGKQYAVFMKLEGYSEAMMNNALFFNKRLVQKAGYNPNDIYKWQENGTWTWDKFKEVAAKISKIEPGKIYGAGGNGYVLYDNLCVSNDSDWIIRTNDGVIFNAGEAKALEAGQFYIDLHKEGILSPDDSSANATQFIAGKLGFLPDVLERLQYSETYGTMKDDYGVVMIPKGPKAKDYASMFNWYGGYALPTGVQNPAEVASVINAISASVYPNKAAANKAATVAQETFVRDEQSLAVFKMVKTRTVTSAQWLGEPVRTAWLKLIPDIKAGNITLAGAVSENKDAFADQINGTWTFQTKK